VAWGARVIAGVTDLGYLHLQPFISADSYDWLLGNGNNFEFNLAMSRPASPGHDAFASFSPEDNPEFGNALNESLNPIANLADDHVHDWSATTGLTPMVRLCNRLRYGELIS